ncbi:hypothetical protein [Streptomyces sp. OR43]|uniref:hypothetical protein n=1 Tax=Streptomyces sp. or43 TaxID=2478957 RepID=UPI0011CE756F|nr:hypothetical protein [Streptomyces sp. or43]TXS40077.1 hypothetical protein EAO72_16785 [Streptomyces sp. or43]
MAGPHSMRVELISFGFAHNEREEGSSRPPVADIVIDLRQHLRNGTGSDVLVAATAGTITAFAGGSHRPVTAAIGCEDGQAASPAFVAALADLLGTNVLTVHHRDAVAAAAAISSY